MCDGRARLAKDGTEAGLVEEGAVAEREPGLDDGAGVGTSSPPRAAAAAS
jgi:hypothetical protein